MMMKHKEKDGNPGVEMRNGIDVQGNRFEMNALDKLDEVNGERASPHTRDCAAV